MVSAIVWKEWRTQKLMALVLILAGVGMAFGLSPRFGLLESAPGSIWPQVVGSVTVLLLVLTVGLITGSQLFAGEREEGTQAFLDRLPVSRGRVWLAKVIFGLPFTLLQCGVIVFTSWAKGLFGSESDAWVIVFICLGLVAFSSGTLGSVMTRTTLEGIIVGLGVMLVCLGWSLALAVGLGNATAPTDLVAILIAVAWIVPFLIASRGWYVRPFRRRRSSRPVRDRASKGRALGLTASLWLAWRQSWGIVLGTCVLALVGGFTFLLPEVRVIWLWPSATLLLGVFLGATVLYPEQVQGTARLWAEQRLSRVRLWLVKTGLHLIGLFLACVLALLPAYLRLKYIMIDDFKVSSEVYLTAELFRSSIPTWVSDNTNLLFLWAGYGFAFGQLAGLLFRRILTALFVGLMLSLTSVMFWVPSLMMGDLPSWQPWVAPAVLMMSSLLLVRAWTDGRLGQWNSITKVVGGLTLALSSITLMLIYRAVEYPQVSSPLDKSDYIETLPLPEEDESRLLYREAISRARGFESEWAKQRGEPSHWFVEPILFRIGDNWDDPDREAEEFVRALFTSGWDEPLREMTELPPGVIEHPRRLTGHGYPQEPEVFINANSALIRHGLLLPRHKITSNFNLSGVLNFGM